MDTAPNPTPLALDAADLDPPDPRLSWRVVFAAFTAAFVLRFTTFFLDDVTRSISGTFGTRLIEEGTGAYAAMLLFPVMFAVERRFPLTRGRWRSAWRVHVPVLICYSVAHTTLLWGSRQFISQLAGFGAYDYGRMPARYFMETPNDIFAYGAFLGIITLLRVRQVLLAREVRIAALARVAAESRLAALSVRLQPHFLFNALNSISSAVYESPVIADEMVGHLGELLRHALRTTDQPEIALSDELEVLHCYLAIVNARFGDRVRCDLQIDAEAKALAVPSFLLQPLVENAVRHGSVVDYPSAILVRIERDGDRLRISVENEIPLGGTEAPVPGTGLTTTRDRLRLLYGDAHSFTSIAVGRRFEVKISIPARSAPASNSAHSSVEHAGADR